MPSSTVSDARVAIAEESAFGVQSRREISGEFWAKAPSMYANSFDGAKAPAMYGGVVGAKTPAMYGGVVGAKAPAMYGGVVGAKAPAMCAGVVNESQTLASYQEMESDLFYYHAGTSNEPLTDIQL